MNKNYYSSDKVYDLDKVYDNDISKKYTQKMKDLKSSDPKLKPFNDNSHMDYFDMSFNELQGISDALHKDISGNIANFTYNDQSFDIDKNYKDLREKIALYEGKNTTLDDEIDDKGNLLMNNLDINPTIIDGRIKDITESSYNRNNVYIVGNLFTAILLIIIVIKT
jgi:hypothetical protein